MNENEDSVGPIELLVLTLSECYVYKVPPLRSASGHRAEDWNLATPLFIGCLKIYQADTKLRISVYVYKDPKKTVTTEDNLQLFGECPVEVKPGDNIIAFVDSVIDSSRYYVLRIKDPKSTRTTQLGIGFRERDHAFDFKNILNDYVRYVNRMDLAAQMAALAVEESTAESSSSGSGGSGNSLIPQINPLKEGEKIKISIGSRATSSTSSASGGSKTQTAGEDGVTKPKSGGFLLKPPPPPGSTVFVSVLPPTTTHINTTDNNSGSGSCSGLAPSPASASTDHSSVSGVDRLSFTGPPPPDGTVVGTAAGSGEGGDGDDADDEEDWGDFTSN